MARGSRGVGLASCGLPAAVVPAASGDAPTARWDALPAGAVSSAHLLGVTTPAGSAAVALAAWVCESEAGSATTPAGVAVAAESALATTRGMMFPAAVAMPILAVAAGLSVPSATVVGPVLAVAAGLSVPSATVVGPVLAVAAGLSVPSPADSLSAVAKATPDFAGSVTASDLPAFAPAATVVAGLQHGRSPEAAAEPAWLGLPDR